MFIDYVFLFLLVLAGIIFIVSFALIVQIYVRLKETGNPRSEEDASLEKIRVWMFLILGVVVIISLYGVYNCHQYLVKENPSLLTDFGVWYLVGFLLRLPLLYVRRHIFDAYFETDWVEVYTTFFTALLGPIQILFTVHGIVKKLAK